MSDAWRQLPRKRPVFELVAHLVASATPGVRTALIEAGTQWRTDVLAPRLDGPVVWGNLPTAGGTPATAARWAARREVAVRIVRRRYGAGVRRIHRLPPSVLQRSVPPAVRRLLLGGVLCELSSTGEARVIDNIVADAGGVIRGDLRLRPSRDGSALVTMRDHNGAALELRVTTLGGRKDPSRNAEALEHLGAHGVDKVPRLFNRGITAGAAWTTEARLHGRLPRRPTRGLRRDIVEFCVSLPRRDEASALRDRMHLLAERYPRWAELARQLDSQAHQLPGITQHGDFWMGNLLVHEGRLAGVIDWDTWHPAGLPGVDLLHFEAMERRRRTGEDIGDLWVGGIWRSPDFLAAARRYWRMLGVEVNPARLELVGLDWWSGQLFKRQTLAARAGWIETNVDRVLEAVSGGS